MANGRPPVASRSWGVGSSVLFALMVLAWAGNYLFVRVGEVYASPLWLATLRAGVGTAGVGVYLLLRPATAPFSWAGRRDALLLGLPNTAVFLGLWFEAAPLVPPGQTAVVIYTFPLWVTAFSPWALGTAVRAGQWAAVAVGFAGIVFVSQPWASGSSHLPAVPVLELLAAAVSWAGATVAFQRRFAAGELPRANGYQLLGGAIGLLAATVVMGGARGPTTDHVGLWISVLWLGLFGTAFAYGVWFFLLGSVHASVLSSYAFLVPLIALSLSVAIEGERLNLIQSAGVALVLLGIYLVGRTGPPHPATARAAGR